MQASADLGIRQAFGDEPNHVQLLSAQLRLLRAARIDQHRRSARIDGDLTRQHPFDRTMEIEIVRVGDEKAARPGAEFSFDSSLIAVRRENDDRGFRFSPSIARQASAPEPSESPESSSTTSGWCSPAAAIASAAVLASATTVTPLAASSAQMPRRTIRLAWTTRTRVAIARMVDPPCRGEPRPATRGLPVWRLSTHRETHGEGEVSLRSAGMHGARRSGGSPGLRRGVW